jgi:hypothetical protein
MIMLALRYFGGEISIAASSVLHAIVRYQFNDT